MIDLMTSQETLRFGLVANLTEEGYLGVVKCGSNDQMDTYIRRVSYDLGLRVKDQGRLAGMIPHYSGEKTSQTYFTLKRELLTEAALEDSWLEEAPRESDGHAAKLSFLLIDRVGRGKFAELSEAGYKSVLELQSDAEMKDFILRAIKSLNLHVGDEGRLNGVVPFYSGTMSSQSFGRLRAELVGVVQTPDAWVTSGAHALLSEAGYQSVAKLHNFNQMLDFIARLANHFGCIVGTEASDKASIRGVVPYYAGILDTQSLAHLSEEVRTACGLSGADGVHGAIHDVVGKTGVLQIRMETSTRFKYSTEELLSAGIVPTEFPATDAAAADPDELRMSCPLSTEKQTQDTCAARLNISPEDAANMGCHSKQEQAITDSHRRALLAAQRRDEEWTAIIEDDVVPLHPGYWNAAFQKAWENVPKNATMVRMGWCSFESDLGSISKTTYANAGAFRVVRDMNWFNEKTQKKNYYTGGCTTGYLVHKSVLPELLGIFPCCCPIDCCLERQLFYAGTKPSPIEGRFRGEQIMVNLDAWDSREDSFNYTTFNQGGILVQDNRALSSLRPHWNEQNF